MLGEPAVEERTGAADMQAPPSLAQGPLYTLRVIRACMKKDIRTALTERVFTIISVFVPVNVLILMSLFVLGGSHAPTAVVMYDTGPLARQFYTAMNNAHSFSLQKTSAAQAEQMIRAGQIVAVVTIPADFDARVRANQPVQVGVQINNLNTDFTNDIRRAVPLSITTFYAKAFPDVVTITPAEHDFYSQDTDYVPYLAVSILVVGLMIGGLLQSGTASAREWEHETIKELLLSPASRWAIVAGKMLAACVMSLASTVVVLLVLIFIIGVYPAHWDEVIGFNLLFLLIFIAFGTLLGTLLKNRQPVTALSFGIAIPLFFLSGAFGPISFDTPATQFLAQLFPVYYAIVLEQHAFHNFRLNTLGTGGNVLVICAYALGLLLLTTWTLRRATVSH
ncbi:MAG TPA: ABC transporter permease [Ktedonobacteraceae bacterium]|nr:ABC transporter permease [Ktedonobacteraceae bacterium]